jgi:hypothetical protein
VRPIHSRASFNWIVEPGLYLLLRFQKMLCEKIMRFRRPTFSMCLKFLTARDHGFAIKSERSRILGSFFWMPIVKNTIGTVVLGASSLSLRISGTDSKISHHHFPELCDRAHGARSWLGHQPLTLKHERRLSCSTPLAPASIPTFCRNFDPSTERRRRFEANISGFVINCLQ